MSTARVVERSARLSRSHGGERGFSPARADSVAGSWVHACVTDVDSVPACLPAVLKRKHDPRLVNLLQSHEYKV